MNPQENFEKMKALIAAIKDHCMCARFQSMNDRFRVIYPDGYFPNGVQASYSIGKIAALARILDMMEHHWKENTTL